MCKVSDKIGRRVAGFSSSLFHTAPETISGFFRCSAQPVEGCLGSGVDR